MGFYNAVQKKTHHTVCLLGQLATHPDSMTNFSIFYISISYITDNVEKVSIRCKFPFCTHTVQMRFDGAA